MKSSPPTSIVPKYRDLGGLSFTFFVEMRNSRFQEESLFLFSETSCWMRAYYFPSLYFYILLLYSWNSRSHAEELFCCSLKQFLNNKHNTCLQQYLFITSATISLVYLKPITHLVFIKMLVNMPQIVF